MKAELKYAEEGSGGQCAMITGTQRIQAWCAGSCGTLQLVG